MISLGRSITACAVGVMSLTGCASLEVTMDVLDPASLSAINAELTLEATYIDIVRHDSEAFEQRLDEIKGLEVFALDQIAERQLDSGRAALATHVTDQTDQAAAVAACDAEYRNAQAGDDTNLATAVEALLQSMSDDEVELAGGSAQEDDTSDELTGPLRGAMSRCSAAGDIRFLARNELPVEYGRIREDIEHLDDEVRRAAGSRDFSEIISHDGATLDLLRERDIALRGHLRRRCNFVTDYLRETSPGGEDDSSIPTGVGCDVTLTDYTDADPATRASDMLLRFAAEAPSLGQAIGNLRIAYEIVSAPDANWGQNINQALGRGRFGNTDIALRLMPNGEFTVKGLQFDPSQTAQLASNLTTSSILFGAQLVGAPVTLSGSDRGSSANGFLDAGARMAEFETDAANREAGLAAQERAISSLALALIDAATESRLLSSDEAVRNASAQSLTRTFTALEPLIKLDPAPAQQD